MYDWNLTLIWHLLHRWYLQSQAQLYLPWCQWLYRVNYLLDNCTAIKTKIMQKIGKMWDVFSIFKWIANHFSVNFTRLSSSKRSLTILILSELHSLFCDLIFHHFYFESLFVERKERKTCTAPVIQVIQNNVTLQYELKHNKWTNDWETKCHIHTRSH